MGLLKSNVIYILILLLSFNNSLKSQESWAPVGAIWYYSLPNSIGNPLYNYKKYFSEKDTLVNGKLCRIIKSQNDFEIMYEENKKVYYYYKKGFKLIYCFSSNIGDTIEFEFKSYSPKSTIIDTTYKVKCYIKSIDSLIVGDKKIRKYKSVIQRNENLEHIVWPTTYEYYEKIGYEYSFLFVLPIPSLGFMNNLRCYNDYLINYKTKWWESQNKNCDYALYSNVKQDSILNSVYYFPNPITNIINLKINNFRINDLYFFEISDTNGRIVFQKQFPCDINSIDISFLKSGLYNGHLYNKFNSFKSFKIIKL